MSDIIFNGKDHENAFYSLIKKYSISFEDPERISLVYILTITENCRSSFYDLYDPETRCVKENALHNAWVTGTDARAIRLAFNLFNGAVPTALEESEDKTENLYDNSGKFQYNKAELLNSTPCAIFNYGSIGKYYLEGIKLRFTELS